MPCRSGDTAAAIRFLREAIQVASDSHCNREEMNEVLDKLSVVHAWRGEYAAAIALQKKMGTEWDFGAHLGAYYLRVGRMREAEQALRRGLEKYSLGTHEDSAHDATQLDAEVRPTFEMAHISNLFGNLQEALVGQRRTAEALEVAEAGRARVFGDLLALRLGINTKAPKPNIPSFGLERMKSIAKIEDSTLVEYSVLRPDIITFNSSGVFWPGGYGERATRLLIWVVKPTGELVFHTVDLKAALPSEGMDELVRTAREDIGVSDRNLTTADPNENPREGNVRDANVLQKLHRLLIQPIDASRSVPRTSSRQTGSSRPTT